MKAKQKAESHENLQIQVLKIHRCRCQLPMTPVGTVSYLRSTIMSEDVKAQRALFKADLALEINNIIEPQHRDTDYTRRR